MDLVEMMLETAERQRDRAEAEYQKALRLKAEMAHDRELEELRKELDTAKQKLMDYELTMRNLQAFLGDIPRVNGTIADRLRTHRDILEKKLPRRVA